MAGELEFWESEKTRPKEFGVTEEAKRLLAKRFEQSFGESMAHPFVAPEVVRAQQLERVRELVDLAFEIPVYRDKYRAAGFAQGDVRTWEDFQSLPVMTKTELIDAFPNRCLNPMVNPTDLFPTRSSGSSGQTLLIRVDLDAIVTDSIQGVRQFALQSGLQYGPQDLLTHVYTVPWWFETVGEDYQMAFISSLTPAPRVAELLGELRQPLLSCYPTNLRALLPMHDGFSKDLRLVVVHSEQSSPAARRHWSEQLGAPVLDEYSSEEATRIALELPCGHYHVCEDTIRLELLDPETMRPQEPGRIGVSTITNLLNTAMPFIRYVQGDLVTTPSRPEPCTVRWGQIEAVGGRANDSFLAADREVPAGTVLDITYRWMFDTDTHIREFELVQTGPTQVRARFVPGAGVSEAKVAVSVQHLEELLAVSLEQPMSIDLELVRELTAPAGKKRRPIRRTWQPEHDSDE